MWPEAAEHRVQLGVKNGLVYEAVWTREGETFPDGGARDGYVLLRWFVSGLGHFATLSEAEGAFAHVRT